MLLVPSRCSSLGPSPIAEHSKAPTATAHAHADGMLHCFWQAGTLKCLLAALCLIVAGGCAATDDVVTELRLRTADANDGIILEPCFGTHQRWCVREVVVHLDYVGNLCDGERRRLAGIVVAQDAVTVNIGANGEVYCRVEGRSQDIAIGAVLVVNVGAFDAVMSSAEPDTQTLWHLRERHARLLVDGHARIVAGTGIRTSSTSPANR